MGSINMLVTTYGTARRLGSAEGVRVAAVPAALPESLAERQGDRYGAAVQLRRLAVSLLFSTHT